MDKRLCGNIMLLITAIIWGTAFVAQSEGMNYVEPFTYNAMRSFLGGMVLIPVIFVFSKIDKKSDKYFEKEKNTNLKYTVAGGVVCGVVMFAASSFQQFGISMTSAGKAGFITALYIIIVPLIELVIYRRSSVMVWICVSIASAGFWLLCIKDGFSVGKGDLLVLCCAFFFAGHIMIIDYFCSKDCNGMLMSCIQFFTAGILMSVFMFIFEKPDIVSIYNAGFTILYAGIMSSGAAYTLQILGQKRTDPVSATLIMSLESVFAALSGWLILNEHLSAREITGCALVFAAVIIIQMRQTLSEYFKKHKKKNEDKI
ncbi:MAG: DMT family transporter [Oscillospiraceae bacterium]|nr:DMT family transporter [Oscillospiraceae bacterium]